MGACGYFLSNRAGFVFTALLGSIAAAVLAMVPLVVADVTFGTGRFNLAQGVAGSAVGIGASLSTTLAGYMSDYFGSGAAFVTLAAIAAAGLTGVAGLMPETRPKPAPAHEREVKEGPSKACAATFAVVLR